MYVCICVGLNFASSKHSGALLEAALQNQRPLDSQRPVPQAVVSGLNKCNTVSLKVCMNVFECNNCNSTRIIIQ